MIWSLIGWFVISALIVSYIRMSAKERAHDWLEHFLKVFALPVACVFYMAGFWWAFFVDSFKQGMKSNES